MALTQGPDCPYLMGMWKDWEFINEAGERLGASYSARKKWRQRRSVPAIWRIRIMNLTGQKFVFDAPPGFWPREYKRRQPRRPSQDARE